MKAKIDYFIGRTVTSITVNDKNGHWDMGLDGDVVVSVKDKKAQAPDASQIGAVLLSVVDGQKGEGDTISLGGASAAGSAVVYEAVIKNYTVSAPGYDDPDMVEQTAEEARPADPSPQRAVEAPESA